MSETHFPKDEYYMRLALREAARAVEHDDVPVGAIVVLGDEVIAAAGNERELRKSPTAHAEMLVIEEAARRMSSWRLLNTVLYVTVEPCLMCAGAIIQARIPHLVYGAGDPKAALETVNGLFTSILKGNLMIPYQKESFDDSLDAAKALISKLSKS